MSITYTTPGVYVEDMPGGARQITAVGTSVAAIIGIAPKAGEAVGEPVAITSFGTFVSRFCPPQPAEGQLPSNRLATSVRGFFDNGGAVCYILNVGAGVDSLEGAHLDLLESHDDISLLVAPGFSDLPSQVALIANAERRKDRMAILDTPQEIDPLLDRFRHGVSQRGDGLRPPQAEGGYACVYTPWLIVRDVLSGETVAHPPSAHMAGLFGQTDARRGVHKAPANVVVQGVLDLERRISDHEQGGLNAMGINCIRALPDGITVWGARTLAGDSSEMRYIPVRRLIMMVAQSIRQGTQWAVFEPNDEVLWKSIRRDVGAFLTQLWRSGALRGATPQQAFFVKCDAETTTQTDMDAGYVYAEIGLATLKPAEFIVLRIGQMTGGGAGNTGDGDGDNAT